MKSGRKVDISETITFICVIQVVFTIGNNAPSPQGPDHESLQIYNTQVLLKALLQTITIHVPYPV